MSLSSRPTRSVWYNLVWFAAALLIGLGALPTAAAAGPEAPVELSYWHFYSGYIGEIHDQLVQQFNETHPHIRVESVYGGTAWTMRDKLVAALSAGAGPDVAGIDQFWISQLAAGGHVHPVEEFLQRDPDFRADDVFPLYWETARYDGRVWSLPFAVSNVVLFYNADLLAAVGLAETDVPATWADLLALAERLSPAGAAPLQHPDGGPIWILDVPTTAQTGVVYYFLISLWHHGGDMFSPDGGSIAFHGPEGVETLALWQRMVERGIIDLQRPNFTFESGRALFQLSSSARILSSYQQLPFRFGVAPAPRGRFRATGIGGRNLAILTTSPEKREAAWEFIRWMTDPETNRRWSEMTGYSPLRLSSYSSEAFQALLQEDPRVETALNEMLYARARPNMPAYSDASRVLGEAVEEALYRRLDPEATLRRAAEEAEAVLRLYGE